MNAAAAEVWTIGRLLHWTRDFLAAKGLDDARLATELLLASALQCRKIELYTRFDQVPPDAQLVRFRELVREAAAAKPIAYLIGHREFYSLDFVVTPDVLIPRPETELLVEYAVDQCRRAALERPTVWDLATGSGCVAIAIAKLLPQAFVVASDVSPAALDVARRNVEKHDLGGRVRLIEADGLVLPADAIPAGRFDLIVSNPPYIPEASLTGLPATVRDYEPRLALIGGPDGLALTRGIAAGAATLLSPAGRCVVEVADGAADAVGGLFADAGWLQHAVLHDAIGTPRALAFGRPA